MNRKRMFFIVTVIFLCLGSAVPVFASAEEDFGNTDNTLPEMTQIVELQKGEALFLPGNGMVQIADERIACAGRNGNIEALEEGETEVVVRYKIRKIFHPATRRYRHVSQYRMRIWTRTV